MAAMSVGELDVLQSGSVIGGFGEPIEFVLEDDEGALTVRLLFREEERSAEGQVEERDGRNDREFVVHLINFNNPLGTATREPIEVGIYDDRVLYVKLYIFSAGNGGKLIHYTWLLGEAAE